MGSLRRDADSRDLKPAHLFLCSLSGLSGCGYSSMSEHIGAPQVQARDGTIAIFGSMEKKTMNGQEYPVGPSLEVVPSIDADGSSVKLKVTARLNVVNPDSITARTAP